MSKFIEFREITKSFPGIVALDNVSFFIGKGEVHAIVGENGAGKSTLIKILSGIYQADSGSITIDGKTTHITSPQDAFELGITCIYQELPLATSLCISDNIFLGQERTNFGFLNNKEQNELSREYFNEFDMDIDPKTPVENLSISMQQITAIIKAMLKNAKVFIMDEPTAALGEHEVQKLFEFIRKLKSKGISVLYISHRMDEIFDIADTVTVLRDGLYKGTKEVSQTNHYQIISLMSGEKASALSNFYDEAKNLPEKPILEVKNLSYGKLLKDINFSVRKGEIFGITGLVGAGKTELLKCIYGLYEITEGEIIVNEQDTNLRGKKIGNKNYAFGLVPEDRKREGLFIDLNVLQNISMSSLDFVSRISYILKKKEVSLGKKSMDDFNIKARGLHQKINFLSGGNQQKAILARWTSSQKKILLLDEPTRGIDVMAKTEIYKLMNSLSQKGITIVFSSSDISEVITVSDRIAAMRQGKIVDIFDRDNLEADNLLHVIMFDA